jgi:hypothetical protein
MRSRCRGGRGRAQPTRRTPASRAPTARVRQSAVRRDGEQERERERREHGGEGEKTGLTGSYLLGGGEEPGRGEDGGGTIKTPLMAFAITRLLPA